MFSILFLRCYFLCSENIFRFYYCWQPRFLVHLTSCKQMLNAAVKTEAERVQSWQRQHDSPVSLTLYLSLSLGFCLCFFVKCSTHIHIRIHIHVRTVSSARTVCFLCPRAKIVDIFHLHQYQFGWHFSFAIESKRVAQHIREGWRGQRGKRGTGEGQIEGKGHAEPELCLLLWFLLAREN